MSNFSLLALLPTLVLAQSPALLEKVRTHAAESTDLSKAEFQACAHDSTCDSSKLSLLVGVLLLSDSRANEAVEQLASRPGPKGLEAFFYYYMGEAQFWSSRRGEALKSWARAKKTAPSWLAEKIDVRVAETYLELGQGAKAAAAFDGLSRELGPELLFERARARTLVGQREKARADLRSLWLSYPTHAYSEVAFKLLSADRPLLVTNEEHLSRAYSFISSALPKRGLEELVAVTAPAGTAGDSMRARVAYLRAQALFQQSDPSADAELEQAIAGPDSLAAEAMLYRARRLLRAADNIKARQALLAVEAKYPALPAADEAAYLAAWLAFQSHDYSTAIDEFKNYDAQHPSSRRRDEARWFAGFCLYKAGRYAEARTHLRTMMTDFPQSSLVPQARYWVARSAQRMTVSADAGADFRSTAVAEFSSVATAHVGTLYSVMARARLNELQAPPPALLEVTPQSLTVPLPPSLRLAKALSEVGLFRDASEEVRRAVTQVDSAAKALNFGHALQSLGDFGAAYALAARYLWGAAYTQKNPAAIALLYPRAYQESVEKECGKNGLDPSFAWAIMRRESAFRPEVTSSADARGLMQLIPPTAQAIAKELKLEPPHADELYSPQSNIALATWYLSALLQRFGNHPTLCAAAYNAGPQAVARWATKTTSPLDEWVEEIPYKETRGYVKQVTADLFLYRSLYPPSDGGSETISLSLSVPEPSDGGVGF